jgi:hypothetical protein
MATLSSDKTIISGWVQMNLIPQSFLGSPRFVTKKRKRKRFGPSHGFCTMGLVTGIGGSVLIL